MRIFPKASLPLLAGADKRLPRLPLSHAQPWPSRSRCRSSTPAAIWPRCRSSSRTTRRPIPTRSRRSRSSARRRPNCRPRSRRSRTPDVSTSISFSPDQDGGSLLAPEPADHPDPGLSDRTSRATFSPTPARRSMMKVDGFLIPSVGNAGGPVFIYNPSKVPNPPKTAA